MNTQAYIKKYQKGKERTSQYLSGPKFNTQSGDKIKQVYFVKPLPRIPDKPTELCDGEFYEFWVHRDCGADSSQALVCLNTNREEFKSNKKKCPACLKIRKILNNETDYVQSTVDKAKKQKAQNRVLWAIYNLNSKEKVEYLEVSGKANDTILDQFQDQGGEFLNLVKLGNHSALQIIRKGSGLASEYTWRGVVHDKFKLVKVDGAKIKASYKYPELIVKRLSDKEFKDIFESAFEVESSSAAIDDDDVIPDTGDEIEDLTGAGEEKAEKKTKKTTKKKTAKKGVSRGSDDDILGDDDSGGDEPAEAKGDDDDAITDLQDEIDEI